MATQNMQNMQYKFYCISCEYGCLRKFCWEQHITTSKHTETTKCYINATECYTNATEKYVCECGKYFKHHSSYYRHNKKCNSPLQVQTQDIKPVESTALTSLVIDLIKSNQELQQQMMEMLSETKNNGTTNNTINNNNSTTNHLICNSI